METVTDFNFLGSQTTADGDCSHEIKGCLFFVRKAMTNLDSILKSKDHFADKGSYSQSYGFSSSVQFICLVVSDSLWPHGLQHARLPCPSASGACSNSCPLSWWCHTTVSYSAIPFSSRRFCSSHVQMWQLDHKECWVLKNWCFLIVVVEKTLENPLDSKEIKPVNLKGNKPWVFPGRSDAETEALIFWPPDVMSQLTGKASDC